MDRGAWQATVHRVAESRTRMSDKHTCLQEPLCLSQADVTNLGGTSDILSHLLWTFPISFSVPHVLLVEG